MSQSTGRYQRAPKQIDTLIRAVHREDDGALVHEAVRSPILDRQSISGHGLDYLAERLHSKRKWSAFSDEVEDIAEGLHPIGHQDKGRVCLSCDYRTGAEAIDIGVFADHARW